MSPRGLSVLALLGLLTAAVLAFALGPRTAPAKSRLAPPRAPKPAVAAPALPAAPPTSSAVAGNASRFALLPALRLENQTTHEVLHTKLYDAEGQVDEAAATALDQLLCDGREPQQPRTTRINRRTLQLLFKAAYHFASYDVEIVSAYRKPGRRREGPHGTGAAIDFRLRGVSASLLASYLRDVPRTGVGVYTHPKTQYVHLDARPQSFHWLDASPPRRHWRERSMGGTDLARRDASYTPKDDLP